MAGPTGPTGATGSQGPAGANGTNGLAEYAYVYNVGAQTVPVEADITFDRNGLLSAGVIHAPGAAGITLVNAGIYRVMFSVSGVEPNQMALFINQNLVPGTVYGSGAGTQQNTSGHAIVTVAAADVLTVTNHSSASAVTLQTLAGGTQQNVNASISLEKIG